jgi:hypothetical protein
VTDSAESGVRSVISCLPVISDETLIVKRRQRGTYAANALCCANIGPLAACRLVESSNDLDGGWHTKACHPVQRVASNLCFDLLTGQSPGEESPSNDGFVPIHRGLNEASPAVARTALPADATILLDGCNMLIALRRHSYSESLSPAVE